MNEAGARVEQDLKRTDGTVLPMVMAAHWALRNAHFSKAKWFIEGALAKDSAQSSVYAEELLYTFIQGDYEKLLQQLNPQILNEASPYHPVQLLAQVVNVLTADEELEHSLRRLKEHPFTAASTHLPCFQYLYSFDLSISALAFEAQFGLLVYQTVQILITQKDYLLAILIARLAACLAPNDANTFAALGMAELVNGFDENADRYLHEAEFRKASDMDMVNLYRYRIFMKQARYGDVTIMAEALLAQKALPFFEFVSYIDYLLTEEDETQYSEILGHFKSQFANHSLLQSTLAYFQLRQAEQAKYLSTKEVLVTLQQEDWRTNACAYYFTAKLLADEDPDAAQAMGVAAIELNPYHPDSHRWQAQQENSYHAMEWMGIFIPKNHEGTAWPNPTQEKLLQLIFDKPVKELSDAWEQFIRDHSLAGLDAGANRLLPFLHKRLDAQLGSINWKSREVLKGIWKKSFFENAVRLSTLIELKEQFQNRGLDFVLLKGIANALDLYGDLGSRPMADLDLLFHPQDMPRVHQLLTELAWSSDDPPVSPRIRFQYASTYRHAGGGMVDIHWRPCEDFVGDDYDPSDLGPFFQVHVQGVPFPVLNPTLNLLTTILHGVAWNHLAPVRWVCDALLIIEKYSIHIDWQRMLELARKYHCVDVLVLGIQYLKRHHPNRLSLPQSIESALFSDYVLSPLMRVRTQSRSRIANAEEIIATIDRWRHKFTLGNYDLIIAVGGGQSQYVRARCELRNIIWMPSYDPDFADQYFGDQIKTYNVITIDGAHSCLARLNSRY